jgi:hypothetical protein
VHRPPLVLSLIAIVAAGTAGCSTPTAPTAAGAPTGTAVTSAPPAVTSAPPTTSAPATTSAPPTTSAPATTSTPPTTSGTRPPTRRPAPTRTSSTSLAPFVGEWAAHTRHFTVRRDGRVHEHIGIGCCDPVIDLVLRLSDPHRTPDGWTATATVVSVDLHEGWRGERPPPRRGQRGRVVIARGLLTESLTDTFFCNRDTEDRSVCGA